VLAYLVTQRTKEIGIRVALGSSAAAVFQLVLREGLTLVAIGLVCGAIGSVLLRHTLESLLFGVTPVIRPWCSASRKIAQPGEILPSHIGPR
jgi:ABC-type lipoprotein release transport system permease subunit